MMVTYSNIPYATVYEIGQRQSDYLDSLDIQSSEDFLGINLFEFEKFLDSKIANITQR
jgi:hypothetical protein